MKAKVALTIGGLDPSGGAGITADVVTFSVIGVHGAAVATALTY
ncbi:MAG: bifunctional hydroxymethylpyrimidine kinase/phosphomethylpyrimidine kinase, partial [bacterium]